MAYTLRRMLTFASAWAIAALVLGTGALSAQVTGSVSGTVTDRVTQRPISGARIMLVESFRETVTDRNGHYLMESVPVGTHTLRVVVIGFTRTDASVTVALNQEANADFALAPATVELNEIVVTGVAGRTEKRAVGNDVTTISASSITDAMPVGEVTELLTARAPGLTMYANTGQAGAGTSIRIRGAGSLQAGYAPVFYIDGIRFESNTENGFSTGNGVVQGSSPFEFLNPNDIESIEVIKGPSATTLYGADAASGVIQIITKKGNRGSRGIRWSAGFEAGQSEWTDQVGQPQNYWLCTTAQVADPALWPGCSDNTIPDRQVQSDGRVLLTDNPVARHPNATRVGNQYKFDLSASGGGETFNYFLSFDKYDEEGVFLNNFSNRTGGRANFQYTPGTNLDFTVNFGYSRTHSRQPWNNNSSNGILRNGFRGRARASNDPWEPGFRGLGPDQSNQYDNQNRAERTNIGLTTNWSPWSWFPNRLTVGLDLQNRRNTQFYEIDTTGLQPFGATNATGTIRHFQPVTHTWTVDYSGTINHNIGDNFSNAFSGGLQLNARQRRSLSSDGEGLVANNLNLVGAAAVTFGNESFSEQTSLGFYGQYQVGFKDKLYVTVAARFDDNSAFGSEFSGVVYPKASVSYVLSDESFFNVGLFDQLKLRGAWGRAGNAPAPFSADRTFSTNVTTFEDASVNQVQPSAFGNANLKAETGSEIELGFDAAMLNGRMGLEFTYYNQRTNDALIPVPDAPSSGFNSSHLENIGTISNQGFEVLLTGTPIYSRNFVWDASLTFSTNNNKLVSFAGARDEISFGAFARVQKHIEDYPLGGYWAVDVVRDASGNPVVDANGGVTVDSENFQYMGPSLPTRESVLSSTFTFLGNVRLYTNFDYKGGHQLWCAICSIRNRVDQNTWDVNNPAADPVDVAVAKSLQTKSWIYPADFIKWRELSLTYTLPASWGTFFNASRWSVTLAGRNLFVWTKYKGTGDPEVNFYSVGNVSQFTRLDYASLPQTRRVSASIRVGF